MSFLHLRRALFAGRPVFRNTTIRKFGGGHKTVPGQLQVPHVHQWHKDLAEYSMMAMWLWILYRFKEDGAYLLVRKNHDRSGFLLSLLQGEPQTSLLEVRDRKRLPY